ncbi:hypothetical protein Pint_25098 [Pistacia integerrima]|uniref:Uncharacterized protein n=1 Tax=Pistacia integerrima TaxID=434235 RepID=A0ACC0YCY6_9ROSI|nr:hypothetical protein Pint_25098 [Pistacia integerrima]
MASSSSQRTPADSSDEEVNVYLKVMKTVALKVKKSDTIKNLKALIREKEGISEYIQGIFFAGNRLEDGQRLIDHGIQKDSTLHLILLNLKGMKLYVEIPSKRKTIEVEAMAHYTVKTIKSLIQMEEQIQSDDFALVYDGNLLEEDMTLASLHMKNESTLHLALRKKHVLSIAVKTTSGDVVNLKVESLFTVGDVKAILGSMIGVPTSNQVMMYAGRKLEDQKTLACYGIKDQSILEMLFPSFQIFVKSWSGKTITLDVQLRETIKDVMRKLCNKLQIPHHLKIIIVYAGKRLVEDRDLASYNIQKHYTLHMLYAPSSSILNVKLTSINPVLSESATVSYVKRMAQVQYEAPVIEVLYQQVPLEDARTLADYGIDLNSEVTFVFNWH